MKKYLSSRLFMTKQGPKYYKNQLNALQSIPIALISAGDHFMCECRMYTITVIIMVYPKGRYIQ